ncbi:MAG: acyl-protein synthetase [Candidatus Eremiobacteraeota bacterium]|nr:acyl-protein synthetase [Candidatus Eremiobacteraeota bacterium]MBV9407208.1 acyl-protein synthetase [Candidatus Eremiobacteraeota bacterium]
MSAAADPRALDARILAAVAAYALDDDAFLVLARDLLAYQLQHNTPYANYARAIGFDVSRPLLAVEEIPAVPAAAFKEARLAAFPPDETVAWFETSGTTRGRGGRHEFSTTALYEAALLASFDRMLLADGARLRYLNLVPDARERPHSSLGHMMAVVTRERGDGAGGWYLHNDPASGEELVLDVEALVRDVTRARDDGAAVCLATTAFALVALLDALAEGGIDLPLPRGSRIMETGGFKGRTRVVQRAALYTETSARLGVPVEAIVAEYGMTELSSQYYDSFATRARIEPRVKVAPPWLRAVVVGGEGRPVPKGIVGAIRHIDLANRGSVIAIETEDLGALVDDGLVLLGREQGAELRGCSLDAEALLARRA